MKLKLYALTSLLALSAGVTRADVRNQDADTTQVESKKLNKTDSMLAKAAIVATAGSLSFLIGGVGIDALKKIHPITHKAFKDFPGKVYFYILGATGVWLYCYLFNKSSDCDVPGIDAAGLPTVKKDKDTTVPLHCMGSCC